MRFDKLIASLLLAVAFVAPAAADVLVTTDGSEIETKGAWKVEGRRVIFTLPNGTLSAVRASDVDLDASHEATNRVLAPPAPAPPPPPPPPPVLVLTNDDLPEVIEGDAAAASSPGLSPTDREPVQLVNWRRADTDEGVEIRGTLRNTGSSLAAKVKVRLEVRDEEGISLGSASAFLKQESLLPGRSTTFKAVLNEVPDFSGEPTFEISSSGVTLGGSNFSPGQQADSADSDSGQDTANDSASDGTDLSSDDFDGSLDGETVDGETGVGLSTPEDQSTTYAAEEDEDQNENPEVGNSG